MAVLTTRCGWLLSTLLPSLIGVLTTACGVSPAPLAPPSSTPPPTLVAPATATPLPPTPNVVPTTRPSPTLLPTPALGQAAAFSTAAAGALTAVPALEATSAAAMPTVASVVTGLAQSKQTQDMLRTLTGLLAGVTLDVEQTPPGALPIDTTRLLLRGSDTSGSLVQLQPLARQLAAQAALGVTSQFFPNATIELAIVDLSGRTILRGSRQPGYQPEATVPP